jgi:membrane protein required for colicin V production
MLLDIVLAIAIVFSVLIGALRGAVRQIAQLVAITVAYLCAHPLGMVLKERLPRSLHLFVLPESELAIMIAFLGLWLVLTVCFGALIRWRFAGDDLHRWRWDRLAGAWLSGLRMSLSLYLALCTIGLLQRELRFGSLWLHRSTLYSIANQYNVFTASTQLVASLGGGTHARLLPRLGEAQAIELIKASPEFREILSRPELQEVLNRGDPTEIVKKVLEESAKDHHRVIEKSVSEL